MAPEYYLGNDIEMRNNGTMKISSRKYITEIIRRYEEKYGTLKKQNVPAKPDDHLELDESPLLNEEGIRHYQSDIGICQWILTDARFDIAYAVSSLSRFAHQQRQGHLENTNRKTSGRYSGYKRVQISFGGADRILQPSGKTTK